MVYSVDDASSRARLETPMGPVAVGSTGKWITWVLLNWPAPPGKTDRLLEECVRLLQRYFAGEPVRFDIPISWGAATQFQSRVWSACRGVPWGETVTYGEIARRIGAPQASQAVGQALGMNPLPILVPCHRVVASDSKPGGFSAGWPWKEYLLGLEGVRLSKK